MLTHIIFNPAKIAGDAIMKTKTGVEQEDIYFYKLLSLALLILTEEERDITGVLFKK